MNVKNWSTINSTIGVITLIKFGALPTPVPSELIDEIRTREDAEGMISLSKNLKLKSGDEVNIVAGAFSEHSGVFECQSDDERIIILLNLMGRDVRVRLPSAAIRA